MSYLILVRHGQSIWNLEKKFTGWVAVELTENGKLEAKKAGNLIKNLNIFPKDKYINDILVKLDEFLKIHIESQISNGASIIQIFDSWAGLLPDKDLEYFVYKPIKNLVDFIRQKKSNINLFFVYVYFQRRQKYYF